MVHVLVCLINYGASITLRDKTIRQS